MDCAQYVNLVMQPRAPSPTESFIGRAPMLDPFQRGFRQGSLFEVGMDAKLNPIQVPSLSKGDVFVGMLDAFAALEP